jgi:signal transduction histidine kinase
MDIQHSKRTRILILFLFGIGLPSLLLAYLAFRGIRNDQALLEQERLQENRRFAELVTDSIDESISEVEQTFLSTITAHQELYRPALIRSVDSLKQQQPLVEEVFYIQSFEGIQLPTAKLLFLPDKSRQHISSSSLPPALRGKLEMGQRFEFQQKSYRQTLIIYRQAFAEASDREGKAELLSAIARVEKKSQLFHSALQSYKTIVQQYSNIRIADEIPLGLAARLELGSLFLAVKDTLSAVKTLIELHDNLLQREWMLEKAQYDFLAQRLTESIDEIFTQASLPSLLQSYQKTVDMLRKEGERQRNVTERLLTFQERMVGDLLAKVPRNPEASRSPPKRFTLGTGRYTFLVSLLSQHPMDENQSIGMWGLLLNADHLKHKLLQHTLQSRVSSEQTGWIVRGQDGNVILQSDKMPLGSTTVKTSFVGNFPPWFIDFYQQEPGLFDALLSSRRSIYLGMFLLIVSILIFGSTFTIRAVAHEMELAKLKSDFVSTISHEFKSPVTSIRQLAEMLKTNRVPSEDRRERYYDVLVEQSERLALLIDNILDFSKMEEGRKAFVFEKTNIGELLQELVSTNQDRVRHQGFAIQAEISVGLPSIKADRAALSQAVNNLIDNAIKYSGKAKRVIVHASTDNQHVVIAVQDCGVGIKKEEITKVFERFYRGGDELTRIVKGSGLGLTLVKQIVEAHHGSVHAESELGHGSTFEIRLPLQVAENKSRTEK